MKTTDFGVTSRGLNATLYTISNHFGMEMSVTDYGAALVGILVPDKNKQPRDVILGYDDVSAYEKGDLFLGAIVGRNANRIGGASFEIDGKTYTLSANDNANNLHSGPNFYHLRMWHVKEAVDDHVTFFLDSPDGDQGYPGNLHIEVTYTLTKENAVHISYFAVPSEDTIINLTNHSYFNLNGHASGSVIEQEVWIDADTFTPSDEALIPTGSFAPVEGTPLDFRTKKKLGKDICKDDLALHLGMGYDHNWVLNNKGAFAKVAQLSSTESGIAMDVYTDLPGMQLYTGNFITETTGKNGSIYRQHQGVCFETQFFPDAIHNPQFKSPVYKNGEFYKTTTVYKFTTT